MNNAHTIPTRDGGELIGRWLGCHKRVAKLLKELEVARAEEFAAGKTVADWLKPKDAKDGEVFHMWYGDSLIAIQNDSVSIRTAGKSVLL